MVNLNGFGARVENPGIGREPIPEGRYLAAIVQSELKETKAGDGQYLELTFQVIDGPYWGRNLWTRLNLFTPITTETKIARAELAAICRAVRVMTPRDSCELHNRPLQVSVKIKRRSDTGELANVITAYMDKED